MRILVTAGNTQTPLDRVRCITNIFSGRTGTRIAQEAQRRGHDVHLLTSHPDLAIPVACGQGGSWSVMPFRTFDELHDLMEAQLEAGEFSAIVHCAAVSDFRLAGIFAPKAGTSFSHALGQWHGTSGVGELLDVSAGKVKSQHPELWLQLVPTPKLVDLIRTRWSFDGVLVKFKLEVGVSDRELEVIASSSRKHSDADLIVAKTLRCTIGRCSAGATASLSACPDPRLPSDLSARLKHWPKSRAFPVPFRAHVPTRACRQSPNWHPSLVCLFSYMTRIPDLLP